MRLFLIYYMCHDIIFANEAVIMNKILSIIIPVYNTEKYILRCLRSVDHPNVQVIVVDDGSTDLSPQLIDRFCDSHDNFEVIHTVNCGAAAARVTGLKQVKTKYFSFVDSDDIVHMENYFRMVYEMELGYFKVGNGRMTVYLPNCSIPFHSRLWAKECLDFTHDKLEFSNLTCSLLDKIWHMDCIDSFLFQSNQIVYEDMEIVYYAIAKEGKMLHSNHVIYDYCMRGLSQNSTSAIHLQVTESSGLRGLLSAATSMREKFKMADLYFNYEDELDAIIIKLIYQRIFYILSDHRIVNRKEMAELVFQILNRFVPGWYNNKYLQSRFKGSEYNDYLFYIGTMVLKKLYGVSSHETKEGCNFLIDDYDKRIVLRNKNSK